LFRESIVLKLDEMISGNIDINNYVLLLVAGTIYFNENSYETALKVLHQSNHLEWYALLIKEIFRFVLLRFFFFLIIM